MVFAGSMEKSHLPGAEDVAGRGGAGGRCRAPHWALVFRL